MKVRCFFFSNITAREKIKSREKLYAVVKIVEKKGVVLVSKTSLVY